MNKLKLLMIGCMLVVSSCGSSTSRIITGQCYTKTNPKTIKVLSRLPNQYKEIGIINVSYNPSLNFGVLETENSIMNKNIEKLKLEASKLGATHIFIKQNSSEYTNNMNNIRKLSALAIYHHPTWK